MIKYGRSDSNMLSPRAGEVQSTNSKDFQYARDTGEPLIMGSVHDSGDAMQSVNVLFVCVQDH